MRKCKGLNVLIADDDPNSMFYLKTVLQDVEVICFEVHTGLEAVNIYRTNPDVDLVLIDLKMPEMSGFEAIQVIKKIRPAAPIIVQTAHVFNDEKILCKTLGCNYFIVKPIDVNNLFSNICQVLKL